MQQIEIIDFIRNILAPVDKTNRYHPENIKFACDMIYCPLVGRIANSVSDYDLDLYTKEYTSQTVTLDATKDRYYTTLPAEIVPIQGITSGIRRVANNQNFDLDFVPITEMELEYMGGSVTQMIDTTIGYWLQRTKIWYDESMTSAIAAAGVRLVLIPKFSSYDSTDIINIPGCSDLEFCQAVIQLLAPTAAVDLKANNSEK